jgi:hypothetical protein
VIQASLNDNLFATEFCMSYKSFKKLYGLLYLDLKPSAKNTRIDAIHPKTKLLIALHLFAGASYLDLMRIHGIGMTTCYQTYIQTVINAILKNQETGQPKWPKLNTEVKTYTDAWKGISGVPG